MCAGLLADGIDETVKVFLSLCVRFSGTRCTRSKILRLHVQVGLFFFTPLLLKSKLDTDIQKENECGQGCDHTFFISIPCCIPYLVAIRPDSGVLKASDNNRRHHICFCRSASPPSCLHPIPVCVQLSRYVSPNTNQTAVCLSSKIRASHRPPRSQKLQQLSQVSEELSIVMAAPTHCDAGVKKYKSHVGHLLQRDVYRDVSHISTHKKGHGCLFDAHASRKASDLSRM